MKRQIKRLAWLLTLAMLFTLASCGSAENTAGEPTEPEIQAEQSAEETNAAEEEQTEAAPSETEAEGTADSSTPLVVYFSRTGEQYTVGVIDHGNTAIVAEMIAEETGADLFEILPAEDRYPLTYDELTDVAKQEQTDHARPGYAGEVPDLSQYDTIFIGAPVWWGDWPMIMYTFFENEDLSGKTLIPFSTHEGSGLSGFDSKLADACPDAQVLDGLAIRGSDAQNQQESVKETVRGWLNGLEY